MPGGTCTFDGGAANFTFVFATHDPRVIKYAQRGFRDVRSTTLDEP